MSKYAPLSQRLQRHRGNEWRASFAEIEEVLGFPLPKGATGKAWWGHDKPHAKAWTVPGWTAHAVDPTKGKVTFRRSAVSPEVVDVTAGPAADLAAPEPTPAKSVNPYVLGGLIAGGVVAIASVAALIWREWDRRR